MGGAPLRAAGFKLSKKIFRVLSFVAQVCFKNTEEQLARRTRTPFPRSRFFKYALALPRTAPRGRGRIWRGYRIRGHLRQSRRPGGRKRRINARGNYSEYWSNSAGNNRGYARI